MSETYTCQKHDFTFPCIKPSEAEAQGLPVGCSPCAEELASAANPKGMTGEDRAAEVMRLMTEPATARFEVIHQRMEALVGRPVWTHEMVNPGALAAEARDWNHPGDLESHLIGSLRDAVGPDKPIVVVRP